MNTNTKNIIISFSIIGIILVLLFIYFSPTKQGEMTVTNTINNTTDDSLINSEMTIHPLESVLNYSDFFTINTLINDYFQNIVDKEPGKVVNVIDLDYQKNHDVTDEQLYKINGTGITYISTSMYYKGINNQYFYFVEGNKQIYSDVMDTLFEEGNIRFMVKVDKDKRIYSITPLDISTSLYLYANTYKMDVFELNKNVDNELKYISKTDEDIIKYYLNYYKELLYLNTEKAYTMLSDETKVIYPNLEVFTNNISDIYTSITTRLLGYEAKGEPGKRYYYTLNNKNIRIIMEENSIMDFIVTIKK